MKILQTITVEYRPTPFPCAEVFQRKVRILFGVIKWKVGKDVKIK